MASNVDLSHPKQELLFYLTEFANSDVVNELRELIDRLANSRQWLIGPPVFMHGEESLLKAESASDVIETIGGSLEIYSALPPLKLPLEIDRQQFDEVTTLINELCFFSRARNLIFEFELDEVYVGAIERGSMDRSLEQGLLGEWQRQLDLGKENGCAGPANSIVDK